MRFPSYSSEWHSYTLSEILTFYSTNSFSREKLNYDTGSVKNIHYGDIHTKFPSIVSIDNNKDIPFINDDLDLSKFSEDQYLREGDLIIADASEDYEDIGKAIEVKDINNEKVLAGLHTILARDENDMTVNGFKAYLFSTNNLKTKIKIIANGISVLGISKNNLSKLNVEIPSKKEQQNIVSFISDIDKKIELLEKKHQLYLDFKNYLMQQIFAQKLRFDFNDEWRIRRLNEITFYQEGPGVRNYQYTKEGVKLLNVGNFVNNALELDNTDKYISNEEAYGKYKHFLVDEGDLLIACSGIKAEYFDEKIAFAENKHLPLCMNTSTMRFKSLDENTLNLRYLKYYFQTQSFKKQVFQVMTGSAQFNFGPTHLKYFKIPIPCLDEQIKIYQMFESIDIKILNIYREIMKVKEFKKGLLQQMFVSMRTMVS